MEERTLEDRTLSNPRQALGQRGEDAAAQEYLRRGARILERNWRHGRVGELDLIVENGDQLIFCEVKTRQSTTWGIPAEAVGWEKQRRIRRLATAWLHEQHQNSGTPARGHVRFDVASVVEGRVDIIEAAF